MTSLAPATAVRVWEESDAARLTADRAAPPGDVLARMRDAAEAVAERAWALGASIEVDGPALLAERERLSTVAHLPTVGRSLRGSTRMLRARDGWVALSLARPADREMLPALSEGAVDASAEGLEPWASTQTTSAFAERAALLDLPCGVVPVVPAAPTAPFAAPFVAPFVTTAGAPRALRPLADCMVLDLSRLWAGPRAAALLAEAGARVVRTEDPERRAPLDPADARFDAVLHAGKDIVDVSFTDRTALAGLVEQADVILTSMRDDAAARLALPLREDQIWVSITADRERPTRTGFGDDCAAEAGLVGRVDGAPVFVADAVADPVTGLLAAWAALDLLASGRGGRAHVGLVDSARWACAAGAA